MQKSLWHKKKKKCPYSEEEPLKTSQPFLVWFRRVISLLLIHLKVLNFIYELHQECEEILFLNSFKNSIRFDFDSFFTIDKTTKGVVGSWILKYYHTFLQCSKSHQYPCYHCGTCVWPHWYPGVLRSWPRGMPPADPSLIGHTQPSSHQIFDRPWN